LSWLSFSNRINRILVKIIDRHSACQTHTRLITLWQTRPKSFEEESPGDNWG
jgi:hypothetical protein